MACAPNRICRADYITRPALANERVQCNAAGQVALKLKTPWRDGTTHLVMSPLEFMQRLAALVPRPALQAAPGQRPGPSPGTNSPLDCLCPGSACI
jgi:Putative transposase